MQVWAWEDSLTYIVWLCLASSLIMIQVLLCREKERSSSSSRRSAEPAKANLLKLQTEVSELNQQLAEAVQAAEAAEGRYRQARAQLRCSSCWLTCRYCRVERQYTWLWLEWLKKESLLALMHRALLFLSVFWMEMGLCLFSKRCVVESMI